MKIIHFAVENFAQVPSQFVKAERALGHESMLVTLYPSRHRHREEDLCLNVPFVRVPWVQKLKGKPTYVPSEKRRMPDQVPPVWSPSHRITQWAFRFRDWIWKRKIKPMLHRLQWDTVDILFLDGGMGFLRYDPFIPQLKEKGIKIVVGYYGSDLRTRGIIPEIDQLADYRFTVEFDHTLLYPGIDFVFFPFQLPEFPEPEPFSHSRIRIGHSPTHRGIKGTEIILKALIQLQAHYPIEIVLIENLPYLQALALKKTCDLFVDCIGELGYGVSALEAMAMGIPTAVEILPDFEKVLGDHPFINISKDTLAEKLIPFIQSETLRKTWGRKSQEWVKKMHDPIKVTQSVLAKVVGEASL